MRKLLVGAWLMSSVYTLAQGKNVSQDEPGCGSLSARQCVAQALDAMGGRENLGAIRNVRLDVIEHTALMEQSYRQAPFITSYERDQVTIDLTGRKVLSVQHAVWPEADWKGADYDVTVVATSEGGAYRSSHGDSPCSRADIDSAEQQVFLGPERLLLTALASSDLHYDQEETLRSTPHAVVSFTWGKVPVHVLLGSTTHLPDAIETTRQFRDYWKLWGDVSQRVYWDNWKMIRGVVYPTNQITERNGVILSSSQVLNVEFNQTLDAKLFQIAPDVAQRSLSTTPTPFKADSPNALADDITLFQGPYNTTIIKQDDGVVILESPGSAAFTAGIFAEARKRYPGLPIKAVLSTSDSWPHIGGIRYDVSQSVPIFALDLNRPLLERLIATPYRIDEDPLEKNRVTPKWRFISEKTTIGRGANQMDLYPLRGAATERQYMVYFPARKLLYASDTLVFNGDGSIYDPELTREVVLAVNREHLDVNTVYAMHQEPVKWDKVLTLLNKAAQPLEPGV